MKYLDITNSRVKKKKFKLFPLLTIAGIIFLMFFIISLVKGPSETVRFIFHGDQLRASDNRTNVLLLGNGGGTHEGADLTDTIIVASINQKTNQVYLISLPRDLWVDSAKGKVNSLYEIGKDKGNGINFAEDKMGEILGVPIHYTIRVDFGGFVKAVDLLGGLDITVEKSFTDSLYPIDGRENDLCGLEEKEIDFNEEEAKKLNIPIGKRRVLIDKTGKIATDSAEPEKGYQYFTCRYETITFTSGETHMDGATTLKFVRSRMGTNGEGSDFARSRRQQLVLEAFRKKALSLDTLSSPSKISSLIQTFGNSIETDVPSKDTLLFYKLTKKIEATHNIVLATVKPPLLINPPLADYGGAWVLVPKAGNFDDIHKFMKAVLNGEVDNEASASARTSN